MYKERKEDLSVYYFLVDKFSDTPFVHIEDGFPEKELSIPTVAVEAGRIDVEQFELGNRDGLRVRKWYIDIFAKNKSQRDEFGYRLLDELKNGINVYNYDQGFPPDVTPDKIGHLRIMGLAYTPIRAEESLVDKLYHRATISIVAVNEVV